MKKTTTNTNLKQPFSTKAVVLLLSITVLALAVAAGYYQELYRQERIKVLRLQKASGQTERFVQPLPQ